jgi:polyisoprenoid-binding protein YceI
MQQGDVRSSDWQRELTATKNLLLVLLAIGPVSSSAAAERAIVLDPDTTQVNFSLQATGHMVRGELQLQSGELRLDSESGTLVGDIVLDTASAQTGNTRRDKAMHRKVLQSELYPLIVLRPERFEGDLAASGTSELRLLGTISLHGDEHALTIGAMVDIDGDRFTAESTFSIPYVEWGLRDPSVLFLRVAKAIEVTVRARGTIAPSVP